MDLLKDIMIKLLENEKIQISFNNVNLTEIVEMQCYQVLQRIKWIIENDEFSDKDCFMKIEKIVCALEDIGSNGGNRHDF